MKFHFAFSTCNVFAKLHGRFCEPIQHLPSSFVKLKYFFFSVNDKIIARFVFKKEVCSKMPFLCGFFFVFVLIIVGEKLGRVLEAFLEMMNSRDRYFLKVSCPQISQDFTGVIPLIVGNYYTVSEDDDIRCEEIVNGQERMFTLTHYVHIGVYRCYNQCIKFNLGIKQQTVEYRAQELSCHKCLLPRELASCGLSSSQSILDCINDLDLS